MFSKEDFKVGNFLTPEQARALKPHFYPTTMMAEVTVATLESRIAEGSKTAEIIRNHGKSILVKVTEKCGDFLPIWYREDECIIIPTDTFDVATEPQFARSGGEEIS